MTPESALAMLKEGNVRFAAGTPIMRDVREGVGATAKGQYPFAAILTCIDSRTSPEHIFDLGAGDAFGVRIAGTLSTTMCLEAWSSPHASPEPE